MDLCFKDHIWNEMGSKFYLCVGMGTRTEKHVFGKKRKKKKKWLESRLPEGLTGG